MKLYTQCSSCNFELQLKKTYNTRPDFIADLGEYIKLNCPNCGITKTYHVNDIMAKSSFSGRKIGTLIGLGIIVFTTLFIWNLGFISNIGLILGGLVIGASNMESLFSNTDAFNKYKVQRTPQESN